MQKIEEIKVEKRPKKVDFFFFLANNNIFQKETQ